MIRINRGKFETRNRTRLRVYLLRIVRVISICLFLTALCISVSYAQTSQRGAAVPADTIEQPQTAPVVLDGRTLFELRGVTSYPARERAKQVAEHIKAAAEDLAVSPDSVHVVVAGDRSNIVVGKYNIVAVVDADARTEGISRKILAEVYAARIKQAIASYRNDRTTKALLIDSLYAGAATVVFIVLVWGVRRGAHKLEALLEKRYKEQVHTLEKKIHAVVQAQQMWSALRGLVVTLRVVFYLALTLFYLQFVLGQFPWTRGLSEKLLQVVLGPIQRIAIAIVDYIPSLIFLVVLIYVTRFILKALWIFFDAIGRESFVISRFEPEWAWPTYRIVRVVVIILALVIAYPYVPGSDSAAFKGISVFVGVLLSLGSSSVVSNVIAGYMMTYRRAFKLGDRVMIENTVGDVIEMRLLVTHVRTTKNEEVVIPNSTILNSQVINYSTLAKEQGLILHTTVGIGYDVPWRQVEALLLLAAERTQGLSKAAAPFIRQSSLGDFAVTYELNAYCEIAQDMPRLYTELHRNILDVFNEYEVQIMTPSYEMDSDQPKVVPASRWYAAPAKPEEDSVNR
jgi:small-conductance mechanosensitive channel